MPEYQLNNQPTQYYSTTQQPVQRVTPDDRPPTPNDVFQNGLNDTWAKTFFGSDIDKEKWEEYQEETDDQTSPLSSDVVTPLLCLMMIFFAYKITKNKISKIVGDFGKKH